jgi:hypothetical protein
MSAPYNPPKKNEDFLIRIALSDMANAGTFDITPPIAAGDFQVDIDGAGFSNLGTLPSVSPSGTCSVLLTLSSTEMNGDVITIRGVDQTSPKAWADFFLSIPTTA